MHDAVEELVVPDETKTAGVLLACDGVGGEEFGRPLVLLQAGYPILFPDVGEPVVDSEESTCWTIAGISTCVRAVLLLEETADSERGVLLLENVPGPEGST